MTGEARRNWFRFQTSSDGVEWAEAFFRGHAFSPHRHDTYAIGCTTAGVQAFTYRGETRHSCPGDVFVLHPDELHDGRPGTDEGYGYRIVYLSPDLIGDALGGATLPFVADAVTRDPRLRKAVADAFAGPGDPEDELFRSDMITVLADAMRKAAGQSERRSTAIDLATMKKVREHMLASAAVTIAMADIERDFGIDRYSLSRQFRRAFGVSPYRYVTLRRLDIARRHIRDGGSLADAAFNAGFADQSHMTRQFRRAFGLTPGAWRSLAN